MRPGRHPVPPDAALAAAIRRLRLQRNMTQEDLAFDADITVSSLSRIERAHNGAAWSSIRAIAGALDISLHQLATAIEEHENPPPSQPASPIAQRQP